MTLNELIEWANKANLTGDEPLRVSAFGGMRGGKAIENAAVGFDWDKGAIVLYPRVQLITYKGSVNE